MAAPFFTDRARLPTEKAVLAALGRAAGAWTALFERMHAEHPDLREEWRYYDDGKSWLLKVARRSTTVCWVSVERGAFRVAFYFPERLTGVLLESGLGARRKAELRRAAPLGKLRRVSVAFGSRQGIGDVLRLVAMKQSLR